MMYIRHGQCALRVLMGSSLPLMMMELFSENVLIVVFDFHQADVLKQILSGNTSAATIVK